MPLATVNTTERIPTAPATRRAKQLAFAGSAALSAVRTRRTVAAKDGRSREYGAPWGPGAMEKHGWKPWENMELMWVYRIFIAFKPLIVWVSV